jgi:hypothetical protein
MVDAFIQDCLAFLIFTVQDSGEQVFLLNDQVSASFISAVYGLQFGQKDGALYAEELCKYEKYGSGHYETEKKSTFLLNDMEVSQEEYDLFEMEWKKVLSDKIQIYREYKLYGFYGENIRFSS